MNSSNYPSGEIYDNPVVCHIRVAPDGFKSPDTQQWAESLQLVSTSFFCVCLGIEELIANLSDFHEYFASH